MEYKTSDTRGIDNNDMKKHFRNCGYGKKNIYLQRYYIYHQVIL